MSNPWDNEPDRLDWTDNETGYACAIERNSIFGTLCGYVGVPPSHPWHGQPYNARVLPPKNFLEEKINLNEIGAINVFLAALHSEDDGLFSISTLIRCHGGITYSDDVAPFRNHDGNWWFGFDCGLGGDLIPSMMHISILGKNAVYRNIEFVQQICTSMAEQLAAIEVAFRSNHEQVI